MINTWKNTDNILDKGEIDLINNFASWNEHLKNIFFQYFSRETDTHIYAFL